MTPEAQRIAIFRAQGFVLGEELGYSSNQASLWYRHDPNGTYHDIPTWAKKYSEVTTDPLTDLNAMHEAEKVLTEEQRKDYVTLLSQSAFWDGSFLRDFGIVHATAAQRAEAFLRTLGKWEGDK